jgi:hypothetical protein
MKYVFKEGPLTFRGSKKADPQQVGEAIANVAKANNGRLTPEATVAAAEDVQSPLHPHFEWDDAAAAKLHRIEQARDLIRAIRVMEDDTDEPRHAFLSIADKGGTCYRTHAEVQTSRDLQLALMRQADRDLEAWEKRYREITEPLELVKEARTVLNDKIAGMEARA